MAKKVAKKKTTSATKTADAKKKKKPAKAAKKAKKKATAAKRKTSRAKAKDVVIPMKVYWGVFNHAMKRVALYEFNQRKAAEKKAKELTDSGKPPHFVMKVKEPVEATAEKK